jgi:hypothetical protein
MKIKKYNIPQKYFLPAPWNVYYARARCQAIFRGAFWAFTPDTWYQMWVDSGVMRHKGRKTHQYRMVRMDPIEAYGPHNCIIVSNRMHYRKLIIENTRRCPKSNFQPHHAVNYKREETNESQQK